MIVELIALRYRIKTYYHDNSYGGVATLDITIKDNKIRKIGRRVYIPWPTTDRRFITCLHELGHCIYPRGLATEEVHRIYNEKHRIPTARELDITVWERELAAWAWAYSFIKRYNKRLKAKLINYMYEALRTYYVPAIKGEWGQQRKKNFTEDMYIIEEIFMLKLQHDKRGIVNLINIKRQGKCI